MERMNSSIRVALTLAFAGALALGGCASKKERDDLKAQNEKLTQEKQQLEQQATASGAESSEMKSTLDDVEKGLVEIRLKELKLIKSSIEIVQEGKPKTKKREELKQEIDTIRKSVHDNLEKLARLEKENKEARAKAEAAGKRSAELQKKVTVLERLVEQLRDSLEEKETMLVELEDKVLHLKATVESQETELQEKADVIQTQTSELNKAYVAIAGKKALKAKGLVEKKGDVLGLGGRWLRTGKFDPEIFREVDVTKESEFPIPSAVKKARILSDHAKESYELVPNGPNTCTLKVTDSALFWRGSKYLVVMTPD